jgi:bacterioferritin-associated ferredoxin
MYVCICKRVRDREIVDAVQDGARNLRDVSRRLGIARQCGKCASYACQIIQQASASEEQDEQQIVA